MADIEYRDIFWSVRTELPGVPVPLLFYHYAETVRDFMTRGKVWQFNIPNLLDMGASPATFPVITQGVEIPANTYVIEPVSIKWEQNTILHFKARAQLDCIDPDWEATTKATPKYWTITAPRTFQIYPLLSTAVTGVARIRVALAPSATIASGRTGMPEELVNEFQDAWGYGAMSRLMRIPGKDWSNPIQAQAYSELYEQMLRDGRSRASADFGRVERTVAYGGYGIGGSTARARSNRLNDFGN